MQAIFGGKNPHPQTLVIGGVTCVEDMLDSARVDSFLAKLLAVKSFIDTAYIPDILIAADGYQDEGLAGVGSGVTNFLCYGGFPLDDDWNTTLLPRGVILGGDLSSPQPLDESMITEAVTHAWYEGSSNLHPYDGETLPDYTGFDVDGHLQGDGKYSWCKAPRYDNLPFEVGPLARFLVGYAQGQSEIVTLVDDTLAAAGLPVTALFSSLGRTAARALETKLIADHVNGWVAELLANINAGDTCYIATAAGGRGDTSTWTPHTIPGGPVQGRWLNEVPRGALGHWVKIDGGVIDKYQAVVPSTWNCSPRDGGGQRGSYEESLIGLELADRTQPLEILRTIHSFDPCMACAVHIIDPRTKEVSRFKVL